MQNKKQNVPAPAERGRDLYESGICPDNGGSSKDTQVHRFESVHNTIRPSGAEQNQSAAEGSELRVTSPQQTVGVATSVEAHVECVQHTQMLQQQQKVCRAKMRRPIKDDFQVQMKTKGRAWRLIGGSMTETSY